MFFEKVYDNIFYVFISFFFSPSTNTDLKREVGKGGGGP